MYTYEYVPVLMSTYMYQSRVSMFLGIPLKCVLLPYLYLCSVGAVKAEDLAVAGGRLPGLQGGQERGEGVLPNQLVLAPSSAFD